MNRLLTNDELEKLNSTDGIIELLCNIPNFNSSMYEELDEETKALVDYTLSIRLITNSQIDSNLRRSMEYNNLALLNNRKLTALSLLYFGIKDDNNRYIGYTCPYTGKYYDLNELNYELSKPYNDRNKDKILELEHIKPHSSGGGTVLFNTIPSSVEANSLAEKSNLHLLAWFKQSGSKYYSEERLYKLVNYILSAYSISFKEYLDSNLDYSYDFEYNDDLEKDDTEVKNPIKYENKDKTKNENYLEIGDYIPFVNSLINKLKDDGYNIEEFNYRLEELQNNGIINDIDKYINIQEIIEKLFKEYSSDDNTSYLTYSLNIDYIKLSNSINTTNKEEIEFILRNRLFIIKNIVDNTNKTMKDYFISLKDNQEIDIIYKDVPTEEEIEGFIKNIKLGINGKINAFIETINDSILDLSNTNNVFSTYRDDSTEENKKYFKGHEDIEISKYFWSNNKERIMFLLFEGEYKDDSKCDIARRNILNYLGFKNYEIYKKEYSFNNDIEEKCKAFIKTINDSILDLSNTNNVFSQGRDDSIEENKIYFKDHEDIEIKKQFWSHNKERIMFLLFEEEYKDDSKYNIARRNISNYNFINDNKEMCKAFIETINASILDLSNKNNIFSKGRDDSKEENKIHFKGHEDIEITKQFWNCYCQERIIPLLFEGEYKTDSKYDIARKNILNYLGFKNYEIYQKEYSFTKDNIEMCKAFIETINASILDLSNTNNVFSQVRDDSKEENKIYFKDHEDIEISKKFWSHYGQERIMFLLFEGEYKDDSKYDIARRNISNYNFINDNKEMCKAFIETINASILDLSNKNNIFSKGRDDSKEENKIYFKGHEEIEISKNFWHSYGQERIIPLLFEGEYKDDSKYDIARRNISNNKFNNDKEEQCKAFIETINDSILDLSNTNNVFSQYRDDSIEENKIYFKDHEDIKIKKRFWNSYGQERIIPLLFYNMQYDSDKKEYIDSDKDYSGSEYDKARQNVLTYLSSKKEKLESIEDYIDKLALKEKKTKKVQNLIDLRNNLRDKDIRIRIREEACIKENIELNNIYNTTTRRAM